ncbi:GPP34 family phosphoprotein [Actinoplanes sp. NPDC051470]|uniref:GOLPH3/VPS74 family protein n=1 Tax=Actinoplanes sp. NPDC051470 TaxID=3157224 RepID=UPI00341B9AB7
MADQLFLASHDSFGEPEVHIDVVAIGLGGALIAELMLAGRVTSENGLLLVLETAAPSDVLANAVLARMRAEQSLSVADWIKALALDAVAEVSGRLAAAGKIRVERPRRFRTLGLTRGTKYVPIDRTSRASTPAARIADTIRRGEYLQPVNAVLAGLMVAMGLHREVLDTWDPGIERHIRYQVAQRVPANVQDVIDRTEASVGTDVITR